MTSQINLSWSKQPTRRIHSVAEAPALFALAVLELLLMTASVIVTGLSASNFAWALVPGLAFLVCTQFIFAQRMVLASLLTLASVTFAVFALLHLL